jgi:hypothetical protein
VLGSTYRATAKHSAAVAAQNSDNLGAPMQRLSTLPAALTLARMIKTLCMRMCMGETNDYCADDPSASALPIPS